MVDLLLLEGTYSYLNNSTQNQASKNILDSLYNIIYKKHHTDSITFSENFNYYLSNKNNYLSLMTSVRDSLQTLDSIAIAKPKKVDDDVASYGTPTEEQLKMMEEQLGVNKKDFRKIRDSILNKNR